MKSILQQIKNVSMAAIVPAMLVMVVAGMFLPAQAQTYPVRFPDPTTLVMNLDASGSVSAVQSAVVGDFNNDGKLDVVSLNSGGAEYEIDVALGNGDGTFGTLANPVVQNIFPIYGQTPYAMAVGDFNGDGNLDLAVWAIYAANNYSEILIFLGNGNGTLTYSNSYTAPGSSDYNQGPNSLFVADFNGDGKLDLAGLTPNNGVFIFMGKGDGTFQTAVGYSTVDPGYPSKINAYGMAVGDLNGDGKMDLAIAQSSGMVVLLNNGPGTFGTAKYYDSGIAPFISQMGIAIGDVSGDKKNDIVITDYYGNVLLYTNQGSGTFAVKGVVVKLAASLPWLVAIADINGDKKMDIVLTDFWGEVRTFLGKGNGTFTAGPIYPLQWFDGAPSNVILADFNGDGVLDIFKAGDHYWKGQVTLGRGDGTFQTNPAYGWGVTGFGNNLVTADFNGDGFPDVAFSWAHSSGSVSEFGVMLGSSHGALAAPTYVTYLSNACLYSYPEWIATGDVNSDGKADIVATIQNYSATGCPMNEVAIFTGLGTGKFKAPVFYSTGASVQSTDVFLADLNGDGKLDIVTSNADGTISVLLNKGAGTYNPGTLITSVASLLPHLNALAIADFNGDGKLDIAVASYYPGSYSNYVYILPGKGDGTFEAPITVQAAPLYSYTNSLAAGDFNHDGKMDLLVTFEGQCSGFYGYASYAFLQGKGDGTFTASSPVCTGGDDPLYPLVADFNGDGKLDAFIPMLEEYGNVTGPVLLQGNGDGTFNRVGQFYVGATSHAAVAADFNGDGMTDIAVLNNDDFGVATLVSFVTVMQNSGPPVSVSPLHMSFGSVAVDGKKSLTVILTNNQSAVLTVDSMTVTGTNASEFTSTSNCGSSLKTGWECTITVTFEPTVTGVQTATLNITDSVGTQTVALTGGVNPKPTLASLSPSTATAGGAGFTLTVNGTGFLATSVVDWAGSARVTTYVSATEVTAAITAADIAKAATYKVTVTNPAPGGGTSVSVNFAVNNPVPTLISMLPNSATHGGAAFTLTVTGTGYVAGSVIKWKTAKLTTTFVNSTTLTATVPSTDIKTAGTAAVTVYNATPGGGTSAPLTFTIN